MSLGLTDGSGKNSGIYYNAVVSAIFPSSALYGSSLPASNGDSSPYSNLTALGLTTTPGKSGIVAHTGNTSLPSVQLGHFLIRY